MECLVLRLCVLDCSAGVGRTGTLITIDRVLDQIQKENVVDVAGTIQHLRNQRMKMVQSPVGALVSLCLFHFKIHFTNSSLCTEVGF